MVRDYKARRRRPRSITRRRPAIITAPATDLNAQIASLELTADEARGKLPVSRWGKRRHWAWAAAALAHLLVIGMLFLLSRHRPTPEALEPSGVSVVFQPGTPVNQAPRQAQIPAPAITPAPPPPAAQAQQTAPEVNLNLPQTPLVDIPEPVSPPAPAEPAPPRHFAQHRQQPQKYTVMNNMSYGNNAASPPSRTPPNGLNLSLAQSDAQAALAPDVTIQGNIGADWQASFNKWVYAHLYYPDAAREQNQQGTVTVEFTAHRDGSVTGLHMTDPSGSPFLDQAWLGIFANNILPHFPPGGDDSVKIKATVRYELR